MPRPPLSDIDYTAACENAAKALCQLHTDHTSAWQDWMVEGTATVDAVRLRLLRGHGSSDWSEIMSEPGLFAAPKPAPLKLSAHFAYTAKQGGPKYTDHRLRTRHQCEECVWCAHEAKGAGGAAIRSVSVKRVVGEETILLCAEHAQRWKDREAPGAARKGRRR